MGEWWTYRLSDFLLFSPRTYYRLFELYNEAVWPAHIAAVVAGLAVPALLWRPAVMRGRILAALLAGAWVFVSFAYYRDRYATINWAAEYYMIACRIEAGLLLFYATLGNMFGGGPARARGRLAVVMVAIAVVLLPLVGPALDYAWTGIEIFALAPDPTVAATLGVLCAARTRARWFLLPIPVIAAFVAGATLWTMEQPHAFVLPLFAVVAIGVGLIGPRAPALKTLSSGERVRAQRAGEGK